MREREWSSPHGARLASAAVGLSLDIDEDGLAVLEFDQPGAQHNQLSPEIIERLLELIREVHSRADEGAVHGLVVASGKQDSFIAGVDVSVIADVRGVTAARAGARQGQLALQALAELPVATVAAINGTCVGGATELALACDYRVAANSPSVLIGLPEVQLGIIPGFGGTQRLPRLISLERALPMILTGKSINAAKARRIGLLDAVVPPPLLMREAARFALRPKKRGARRAPEDRGLGRRVRRWLMERNPLGRGLVYRQAAAQVAKSTGGHYPAPVKALEAVRRGLARKLGDGLRLEADLVADAVVSPESRNLVGIFFLRQAARRARAGAEPVRVRRLGVLGAGVMGGGIAQLAAQRGVTVRVKDIAIEPLAAAMKVAHRRFSSLLRRRRMDASEVRRGMARISATLDYSGFRRADLIIEAVVENLAIKHEVLAAVEAAASSRTVLATNTSSLTVASMAAALQDPSRFVGLHFFNPVHRMPLVEIVRGPESVDWAVDTARAFATAIGKVPVVVGDAPGFFVNRVLTPYINEALLMLGEGATVTEIDSALEAFGMPMGPLRLLDEIGLDVAAKVTVQLADVFGEQMPVSDAAASLVESGRLGRKGGAGFYAYPRKGRPVPDGEAEALVRGEGASPPAATIVDRCVLGMLNGSAKALEEGIVASPQAADLALVFGTGFAPFRGGVFRYAEERGVEAIRDRMAELAETYGPRFAPGAALGQKRFYPDSWPEKLETL